MNHFRSVTIMVVSLLLCGCVDLPLATGKARVWFPMRVKLDSAGNVTEIGPDDKTVERLANASPELVERGMTVWTRLHPDKNAAEPK